MLHIILYQPEIPPNTGNIIRLCANTGARLHLIHPLGFTLDDARLKRAGLDYHEWARINQYDSLDDCLLTLKGSRIFALTTKGQSIYSHTRFLEGDAFLLGPETRGLPIEILNTLPATQQLIIPQQPQARSLNLSNATSIVLYEAWRQLGFK